MKEDKEASDKQEFKISRLASRFLVSTEWLEDFNLNPYAEVWDALIADFEKQWLAWQGEDKR